MTVTVTTLDGGRVVYGYDPCHRVGVNLYYAQELAAGTIAGYVIDSD